MRAAIRIPAAATTVRAVIGTDDSGTTPMLRA
jgi:hypothetical protein